MKNMTQIPAQLLISAALLLCCAKPIFAVFPFFWETQSDPLPTKSSLKSEAVLQQIAPAGVTPDLTAGKEVAGLPVAISIEVITPAASSEVAPVVPGTNEDDAALPRAISIEIITPAAPFDPAKHALDKRYHDYEQTEALLKNYAARNPDIATVFSIGKTTEGRDIWAIRISSSVDGEKYSGKPGAVFIGNHHAREHISNEIPLKLASWLLRHRADAEIAKYLQTLDIFIIPMLNPDGVEFDLGDGQYKYHRKNMRKNADGTFGVDLNRNYDFEFGKGDASTMTASDNYCGPAPFSEPETLAVKTFIAKYRNMRTMVLYHASGSVVRYPWAGKENEVENSVDRDAFIKIAQSMAQQSNYTSQPANETGIIGGDAMDWAYAKHNIFAFTIELDGNSDNPSFDLVNEASDKNIKSALYLLSVTDNPYNALIQ